MLMSCTSHLSQECRGTLLGLKSAVWVGGQMGVGEGSLSCKIYDILLFLVPQKELTALLVEVCDARPDVTR